MIDTGPLRTFQDGLLLLTQLDLTTFVLLFWYTLTLEVPRYLIGAVMSVAALTISRLQSERGGSADMRAPRRFTVLVPGHNEAAVLPKCIAAIREQTAMRGGFGRVVVVDDGSTDATAVVLADLKRRGLIDVALSVRLRGGKSAAVNLGLEYCTGEIVIIVDADTSFDRDAFERILAPFADPAVGAVAGNIDVRNASSTLTTRFQAIEYLISISLGRRVSDALGILSIVSGAFGAFRSDVLRAVGGQDVEVGEDADLTVKLRRAGWRVCFAADARAMTDVPETVPKLIAQRLRWDRSVITIWGRKFRSLINPAYATFRLGDAIIILDTFFFQFAMSAAFIGYMFWLFEAYGSFAWVILAATLAIYVVLSGLTLILAIASDGRWSYLRLLPYVPFYTVFNCYVMRIARLVAFIDEIAFRRSYRDPYVPRRVMDEVERF